MTVNLGNSIVINCSPDEILAISKYPLGGFVISAFIPSNKKEYELVVWEGVKVFDRNQLKELNHDRP
jgi:hypothetical protein